MVLQSKCLKCYELSKGAKEYCSYKCSKKRKIKIYPSNITISEIKRVLENNIGCNISEGKISEYQREIREFIN